MGFRFSAVFGSFETGNFDITLPVKGEISEVIVKTGMNETPVRNARAGSTFRSERYGVGVYESLSTAMCIPFPCPTTLSAEA